MEKEIKPSKFTIVLNRIDDFAEAHHLKTLWQIAKFMAVSFIVSVIQLGLVNLLYFLWKDWTAPLPPLLSMIFSESTVGEGHSNWGYILPFFLSNLIANTVGYFLNRSKTFKSDAPIWHYIVYVGVLLILIFFTTWLQGVAVNIVTSWGAEGAAPTLAAMLAGTVQMVILFPIQKFILLRERKSEPTKPEEDKNEEETKQDAD